MKLIAILLMTVALASAQTRLNPNQIRAGSNLEVLQSNGTSVSWSFPIKSFEVASLPTPASNMLVLVTDCESASACTTGGGTTRLFRFYTGGVWTTVGGAGSGGLADPGNNGIVVRTALDTTTNRTLTGTANEITVADGTGASANPTFSIASAFDISGKTSTKPIKTGTAPPGTCSVGEYFFDSDAAAGRNTYACTATNTWTLQGDGNTGGSGADFQINSTLFATEPVLRFIPGSGMLITGTNVSGTRNEFIFNPNSAVFATHAAIQANTPLVCVDSSGSATTKICAMNPALTAYTTNSVLWFRTTVANTSGAFTVNIDALGAKDVKLANGSSDPATNEVAANTLYPIWYDGTNFRLISTGGSGGGSVAGRYSATVDFGSIPDGSCLEDTFTATGITSGAALALTLPSGLDAGLIGSARVSASNTVAVRLCNFSGAAVDPASATYAVRDMDSLGYLKGTATINFGSIPDGSCLADTFTLTGAATGDTVSPAWPSGLETGLFGSMLVSATNTVQVRLCNFSGSAVDPASATFGAAITK